MSSGAASAADLPASASARAPAHALFSASPPSRQHAAATVSAAGALPQCKIKRNYTCALCGTYFTQNPRSYLYHLRDAHGQRLRVYECPRCLYASRHSQKLQRHMHMVHAVGPKPPRRPPPAPQLAPSPGEATETDDDAYLPALDVLRDPSPPPPPPPLAELPLGGPAIDDAELEDEEEEGEELADELGMDMDGALVIAEDIDDEMADDEAAAAAAAAAAAVMGAVVTSPEELAAGQGTGEFRCGVCPFRAASRSLLARHEALAHLKKKFFRCGKCSYATHLRARFTKHVKYHSMPMIKCSQCDFRTPYKWNLDRHCRNHGAAGAFRCTRCSFTADIKQSLTVHEMNHHAPPSGPAPPNRRRLKVGASDSLQAEERELMARQTEAGAVGLAPDAAAPAPQTAGRRERPARLKVSTLKRFGGRPSGPQAQHPQHAQQHNFRSDFIHPDDIIHHKNGNVYIKTLRCRLCNFKAAWEGEMARHEAKVHGIRRQPPQQPPPAAPAASAPTASRPRPPRPVPNLIPIQSKAGAGGPGGAGVGPAPPILRIPSVRPPRRLPPGATPPPPPPLTPARPPPALTPAPVAAAVAAMSERDMDEICAKSCATSALKDFAPLIGGDAFTLADGHEEEEEEEEAAAAEEEEREGEEEEVDVGRASPDGAGAGATVGTSGGAGSGSGTGAASGPQQTVAPGRKGFLDQLGERLLESSAALECEACGVRASCLSELARHKRTHDAAAAAAGVAADGAAGTAPAPAPGELSSTRCQRCRQRCKTSAALLVHLRTCCPPVQSSAAAATPAAAPPPAPPRTPSPSPPAAEHDGASPSPSGPAPASTDSPASDPASPATATPTSNASRTASPSAAAAAGASPRATPPTSPHSSPHPMENRVFVWNNLPSPPGSAGAGQEDAEASVDDPPPMISEPSSPSTPSTPPPSKKTGTPTKQSVVLTPVGSVKKVFKCPHCSFWASTASRFHVHIVGHLNKKPFECSLCAYRSNWRWDITKHIRLKSARDSGHERARVLMTDETGRRNYAKYNKYLTVLRVRDGSANQASARPGSSPTTKPVSDSPNSVESAPQLVVLAPRNVTAAALASTLNASEANVSPAPPLRPLLPAPPRLTPAPAAVASGSAGPPPLTLAPLRPPPPLAPAVLPGPPRLHPAPKRPAPPSVVVVESTATSATAVIQESDASGTVADSEPPAKKASGESKRTLWKCKKCNFKDPQRELVLAHVKQHYQQRAQAVVASSTADSPSSVSESERHCRLKHDGNVQIVTAQKYPVDSMGILGKELSANETPEQEEEERNNTESTNILSEPLQCPTCPYSCLDPEDLNQHQQNHQPQQGAIFKCYLCPYYVALKTELHDHLQLHGVSEPEEHLSRTLQGSKVVSRDSSSPSKVFNESDTGGNDSGNSLKRYRCAGCPYVSNSKSQFLYHKQFHRPRGAPFKCGLCSYSVSRRHLLHQHLRVHGILIPPQRSPGRELENERTEPDGLEDGEEEAAATGALRAEIPDLDTRQLPEVPLVWVCRNGRFDKLYKCRWCPHVNQRKANIVEHEKMHRRDEVEENSDGEESTKTLPPHRCPLCNYGCHNAGVLSAHMKVHQGAYGTVRALVDLSRSDEAQLEELGAANDSPPPLLLPQTGEDMNQGIEDAQEETVDFRIEPPLASEPPPSLEEELPSDEPKILMFCQQCPARFLVMKELNIHKRFHEIKLAHRCESCNYTARQRSHLLAHIKVHSDEYQERSESLAAVYPTSPDYPRPRTAVIVEGPGVSGPVWVVVSDGLSTGPAAPPELRDAEDLQDTPPPPPRPVIKQFSCTKCPAKFFKTIALEYHKTLHGGSGNYGCKYCDYRVKTYGNLVKHEMIHEHPDSDVLPTSLLVAKPKLTTPVPLSGTDLFQQRAEVQKLTESNNSRLPIDLPADPQFGTLMHGNPEFVYPMYFKNGRLKEKRYKCHKCPSAFEKREQYKVHLSLHGSKQRYKCEICDYSVKYYANFIQHQRKHQHNDEAHAARRAAESNSSAPVEDGDEMSEDESPKLSPIIPRSTKSIGSGTPNKQIVTAAEQQARMLDQVRERVSAGLRCDEDRKVIFRCGHCPYASARRDGLESHAKRHAAVSGICGAYTCQHCDYSAPQLHFLRDHVKLHFDAPRKLRPEAYTRLEKLTVWMQISDKENETHTLIFQDKGLAEDGFERFYPPLPEELQVCDENSQDNRIYIDIRTGDPLSETAPKSGIEPSDNCEGADEVASQTGIKKKTAASNFELVNPDGEEGVEKNRNAHGNSSAGSSNAEDEDCCEEDNGGDVVDADDRNDDDGCDVDDEIDNGNDNANRSETVAENESEEESRTSSKIEIMTRRRTARKSELHSDNSAKNRKVCNNSKDGNECDSESEDSEDIEVDVEGDDTQVIENVSDNQKPEVPVPDDGESRLSASSSCDSTSSNSSSGSSSSSSSSSSSGTSSSSTTNDESKSSDSSSECDAEESDRDPTPAQHGASQDESLSSDT